MYIIILILLDVKVLKVLKEVDLGLLKILDLILRLLMDKKEKDMMKLLEIKLFLGIILML